MNPLDLTGHRVLVTGASSGIGRVTAMLLSQLGATIVLVGRDEERLAQAEESLSGDGHITEAFDLNHLEEIDGWLKSVVENRAGPLSGLVHSAGVGLTRPLKIMQAKHYESIVRINLLAAGMLAKSFRRKGIVADNGGALVFISSVAGLQGWSGFSAYAASKAGLHGLTRSLAVELAGERIRVNAIAAGAVQTPMLDEAQATGDVRMQAIQDMHPLGIGDPMDIAHAVAFLLAGTGRWITGAVLPVDGGCSA